MAHRKVYAAETGRYGTRMMTAGEPMVLSGPAARAALALGKATATRPRKTQADVAPTPDPAPPATDDRPALRAAYEAKFGKKAFPGWSADLLREKLAAG